MPISGPIKCYFCDRRGVGSATKPLIAHDLVVYQLEIYKINFPACGDCMDYIRDRELVKFKEYIKHFRLGMRDEG